MNKEVTILIIMVLTVLMIAIFYGVGSGVISNANESVRGEGGLFEQEDNVKIGGSFSKSYSLNSLQLNHSIFNNIRLKLEQ